MGGMTPNWLAQMAPPHAPPPPGWWPLAAGWWAMLALVLTAVVAAAWAYWRAPSRVKRAALRELTTLGAAAGDDQQLAPQLAHLVRRVAVTRFGRETVAQLAGDRWLAFVVDHGGRAWAGEPGAALLQAAYGGAATAHRAAWLDGARGFIRGRR